MRWSLFVAAVIAVAAGSPMAAAQTPAPAAAPRTPADTALLVNAIASADAQAQLRLDLRDPGADVRAVAARVAAVSVSKGATPTLMSALAVEQDARAGAEMIRALLTVAGAGADAPVALAAERLGGLPALTMAQTLARTRPSTMGTYVPLWLRAKVDREALGKALALAIEGAPDGQSAILAAVAAAGDGLLWGHTLDTVRAR
jgi:hypothetical protein